MANYLVIFSAPDKHIDFLSKHPEAVYAYYEGEVPVFESPEPAKQSFFKKLFSKSVDQTAHQALTLPSNWPTTFSKGIGPEVNHRNVDLYHRILNNNDGFVTGSGSIFQTWLTDSHSAVNLDTETFAFKSHQLPELLTLVKAVTVESTQLNFAQWLNDQGKEHVPDIEESQELADEFAAFASKLEESIEQGHGVVWVMS